MSAGRTNTNQTSQAWNTPIKYAVPIMSFFDQINLDPCSNKYSIIEADVKYSLPFQDGLVLSWDFPKIFVNPPYGSDKERKTSIKHWLAKCAEASEKYNSEVIALIPVATNTKHWKDSVFGKASCICFLYDTRLKFMLNGQEDTKGAPMACCLVYWGIKVDKFFDVFSQFGFCVRTKD